MAHSTYKQVYDLPTKPMTVKFELLPPCQQLLVESRQLQTVAALLIEQTRREITTAKRNLTNLNVLRQRLRDSYSTYIHDDFSLLLCRESCQQFPRNTSSMVQQTSKVEQAELGFA